MNFLKFVAFVACFASIKARMFNIQVGADIGVVDQYGVSTWQGQKFYPNYISINVGDSITFSLTAHDPHTITFAEEGTVGGFTPAFGGNVKNATNELNSGLLFPGQSYVVTFVDVGVYPYDCVIHDGMDAVVEVTEIGGFVSEINQTVIDQIIAEDDAFVAQQELLLGLNQNYQPSYRINSDGTKTWSTRVGPFAMQDMTDEYTGGMFDFMRFSPAVFDITVGDSIDFVFADVHALLFANQSVIQSHFPGFGYWSGYQPKNPSGQTFYGGSQILVSDMIFAIPSIYTIKFSSVGTFPYVCWMHDISGMYGSITVNDCEEGSFWDSKTETCRACHNSCSKCVSEKNVGCTKCNIQDGFFFDASQKHCVSHCHGKDKLTYKNGVWKCR